MALNRAAEETHEYPVRVAARMTGLTAELMRAWETRHDAIQPARTAGGARRYSDEDLRRLCLLRDLVAAGYRIGGIARRSTSELEALLHEAQPEPSHEDPIARLFDAAQRIDGERMSELVASLIEEQGPVAFASEIALPLLARIGKRWQAGDLNVSVEHFATCILRSALISELGKARPSPGAPKLLFATPSGEPHDLGSLVAAVIAASGGGDVVFLGADIPVDDLTQISRSSRADALVLGIVTLPQNEAEEAIRSARRQLPESVEIWLGGAGITGIPPIENSLRIENFAQLQAQQLLLDSKSGDLASRPTTAIPR